MIQLSDDLQLFLITPEVFRVCVLPAGLKVPPQKPPPLVVPEKQWDEVSYTLEAKGDDEVLIEIEQSGHSIIYYSATQQLVFRNHEGTVVLQEGERNISKSQTENYFSVQQSFLLTQEEELFGGGQFQNGYMNWRGSPLFLQQRNTETIVPFFMSSAGYGLLWETSAPTWLNPIDEFSEELDLSSSRLIFIANSQGPHYFTLHCPNIVYGDSIQAKAVLTLKNSQHEQEIHRPINWWSRNKPPTLSGRVSALTPGVEYEVTLDCENCCRSFHSKHNALGLQLFASRPTESATKQHTFRTDMTQFIDYYIMIPSSYSTSSSSSTMLDSCVKLYRTLTGKAPMLPLYTLGFWFSKEHYSTGDELLQAARQFRARQIPVDGIVQDWKYWGDLQWSPQWDTSIYPNPQNMITELHDLNYHIMVSVWCKFENASYLQQARKSKELVDGTNWLDMYQSHAQQSLYEMIKDEMYSIGVDSIWLDATEPEGLIDYDKNVFPYGVDKEGVHANSVLNSYSLAVTESITALHARDYPNLRPFHLTRSSFSGQQRTSGVVWSGDISGNFDMLARQVTASINYAMSGHPYWSMDTGGFFRPDDQYESEEYKELLTRWFQFAVFVPLFRYHGQGGELWLYGETTLRVLKDIIQLRYRLLPYIYSLINRVELDDYTLQRHFLFDFAWDAKARNIENAFMFGPYLLVAPIVQKLTSSREVYLPSLDSENSDGNDESNVWYSFFSGITFQGSTIIDNAEGKLSMGGPPLYVPAGSILTLGPYLQFTEGSGISTDPLEVRIYRGRSGEFTLYEDGGYDYDYRGNGYVSIDFTWKDEDETLIIGAMKGLGFPGMKKTRTINIVLVDKEKGVGTDICNYPDARVEYTGEELTLKPMEIYDEFYVVAGQTNVVS